MTVSIPDVGFDLVGSPYLLLNLFLTALLAGLVLALLADSYIDRAPKRIILIILLLTFSLIVQSILEKTTGTISWTMLLPKLLILPL